MTKKAKTHNASSDRRSKQPEDSKDETFRGEQQSQREEPRDARGEDRGRQARKRSDTIPPCFGKFPTIH